MQDNHFHNQHRESFQEELHNTETLDIDAKLIVYNDDHNTFDWVIESFVQVCRHSLTQAEQLSYIVHFNGKATVKTGNKNSLHPFKDALVERGLSAVIEE